MNNYEWRDAEHKVSYYFTQNTGRIVGQVYNMAHTNIYGAKVYNDHNEEKYLGQYISYDTAKKATEEYWNIQNRTLLEN
jgi:hypothetical protein